MRSNLRQIKMETRMSKKKEEAKPSEKKRPDIAPYDHTKVRWGDSGHGRDFNGSGRAYPLIKSSQNDDRYKNSFKF